MLKTGSRIGVENERTNECSEFLDGCGYDSGLHCVYPGDICNLADRECGRVHNFPGLYPDELDTRDTCDVHVPIDNSVCIDTF
jgi:hypothetical protein